MHNSNAKNVNAAPPNDPNSDWALQTNLSVGEILRRTRAHYGLSMKDVEGALRIRASQLTAIEEGAMEKLPGRVYAIGFVRAYSEFLGLDGNKMVHLFKVQMAGGGRNPELSFPVPASESKVPNKYVLGGSAAAVIAVMIAGYFLMSSPKPAPIPNVPATETAMNTGAMSLPASDIMGNLLSIEPAAGSVPLVSMINDGNGGLSVNVDRAQSVPKFTITATDNAWIEIRNKDGEALISRILKPEETYIVPHQKGLVMDAGNVGVLVFEVNGQTLPPLGEHGDVKRNMPIAPEILAPEMFTDISFTEETGTLLVAPDATSSQSDITSQD